MTETRPTTDPNILQLTEYLYDSRFYQRTHPEGVQYAPSITHALGHAWPTQDSFGLQRWIGDVGNRTANEIKEQAGKRGTVVHDGIQGAFEGEPITLEMLRERFDGDDTRRVAETMRSFTDFVDTHNPRPFNLESVVWIPDPLCAGTIDFEGYLDIDRGTKAKPRPCVDEHWILDWKSSNDVHPVHRAQLALYWWGRQQQEPDTTIHCGIVHLGNRTKKKWSLLELDGSDGQGSPLHTWATKAIDAVRTFHLHNPNSRPSAEVFPDVFSIDPDERFLPEETTDDNGPSDQ